MPGGEFEPCQQIEGLAEVALAVQPPGDLWQACDPDRGVTRLRLADRATLVLRERLSGFALGNRHQRRAPRVAAP
jgi:hypothetical protein